MISDLIVMECGASKPASSSALNSMHMRPQRDFLHNTVTGINLRAPAREKCTLSFVMLYIYARLNGIYIVYWSVVDAPSVLRFAVEDTTKCL